MSWMVWEFGLEGVSPVSLVTEDLLRGRQSVSLVTVDFLGGRQTVDVEEYRTHRSGSGGEADQKEGGT